MKIKRFATQEFIHDPEAGIIGDCWRAGIASILGVPIGDVPHFVRDYKDADNATTAAWFDETCRWLTDHYGLAILFYDAPSAIRSECRAEVSEFPYILVNGISPRGIPHVVVGDAETGDMVHDTHPDGNGLAEITGCFVIVKGLEAD